MKKILIIDDDQIIATTYALKLQAAGFVTQVALDGDQGVTEMENFVPDLVILDVLLPDISGIDLHAFIRKDQRLNKTPVVMLSNHYLEAGSNNEIAAGLTRSLVKAETTPSKVLEIIKEMLALAEPQSEPPGLSPLQQAREQFCVDLAEAIQQMRIALQTIARSKGVAVEAFDVIKSCGNTLTAAAAELGLGRISHLTSALAGLAQKLSGQSVQSTASTSRTIAGAIDALDRLEQARISTENRSAPLALVVEDEIVTQTIIRTALDRSRIRSIGTADGELALTLLENNRFDIIFLDVTLPGINGYEVCTALRKLPGHQVTPVIFITGLKEFEARAQSILSGANDLIAKPVFIPELAVKALTHLINEVEGKQSVAPAQSPKFQTAS